MRSKALPTLNSFKSPVLSWGVKKYGVSMFSKRSLMRVRGMRMSVKVPMISILARLPGLMFQWAGSHVTVWFIWFTKSSSSMILFATAIVSGTIFLFGCCFIVSLVMVVPHSLLLFDTF